MDPVTELTRTLKELREVLPALDAIQTPELVRPDVPEGDPVTRELAYWSLRVYAYSILSQFREMLRSTLMLQDAGQIPAVFLCCRALFEMAAHAYYVKKHALQHLDEKNYQAVWDFMSGVNQGSRYMRERQKAGALPHKKHEIQESPHIAKIIACFNEYFQERGKKEATENYSFLSEFCHPNSFAFINHMQVEEPPTGVAARITFGKPAPETSVQVLPDALFSCMPLLFCMDEMLNKMNDTGFGKACQEFARITYQNSKKQVSPD
jgi:hypothetical protein